MLIRGGQRESGRAKFKIIIMLEINKNKIKCSIFSAREGFIQELNHDIWRADLTSGELVNKAHSLFSEADLLFNCPKYKQEDLGCRICKTISELRKKRANYLISPEIRILSQVYI